MGSIKRNSLFGFLGFAIPTIILFFSYPIFIQKLGEKSFGIFILATSLSGTLAFLDLGFSGATLKYVAEDIGRKKLSKVAEILNTSVTLYFAIGVIAGVAIWAASPRLATFFSPSINFNQTTTWVFRLAAIQFVAFFINTVFISFFKGLQRFYLSTICLSILSFLTYGLGLFFLIFFNANLLDVTILSVVSNVTVLLISIFLTLGVCKKENIPILTTPPTKRALKRMFPFSTYILLNHGAGFLQYHIQKYLVGIFIGPAAVTIFHTAMMVTSKTHSVITSGTEVLFPYTSTEANFKSVRKVYLKMLFFSAAIATVLLLSLILFANLIFPFWLGENLAKEVVKYLPYFAVGYFFISLSPAPFFIINGIGKPYINTIFAIITGALNIFLIIIFYLQGITIKDFAIAFAISNFLSAILFQSFVEIFIWKRDLLKRALPNPPNKDLKPLNAGFTS